MIFHGYFQSLLFPHNYENRILLLQKNISFWLLIIFEKSCLRLLFWSFAFIFLCSFNSNQFLIVIATARKQIGSRSKWETASYHQPNTYLKVSSPAKLPCQVVITYGKPLVRPFLPPQMLLSPDNSIIEHLDTDLTQKRQPGLNFAFNWCVEDWLPHYYSGQNSRFLFPSLQFSLCALAFYWLYQSLLQILQLFTRDSKSWKREKIIKAAGTSCLV